jgi:hypothetical protein
LLTGLSLRRNLSHTQETSGADHKGIMPPVLTLPVFCAPLAARHKTPLLCTPLELFLA